jgi:hypothetical protein
VDSIIHGVLLDVKQDTTELGVKDLIFGLTRRTRPQRHLAPKMSVHSTVRPNDSGTYHELSKGAGVNLSEP